ncbi:acyl-CoA--sterol O-acyltransferase 1 [Ziziphus jujuba]|uniref:Acyl-CoA--sterol O-acyltransferase 1 n=2 Tax=Ziziphus jujuba TaxID=326968 RepID=A0ABM3I4Q5_ZIZJJ|nr:acyl-CoA--sterol O-acyltransferase 1 [Ziziphus jujuba]KAH7545297.1 hypothetical protein FEM48_Zijuj01G0078700 [Ziziphus jujuba var. spinosa]
MEGELSNFFMVWMSVVASLCYCRTIGNITKQGTITRFLLLLPVISLFLFLPLNLTTVYLGGATSFFVAWLAVFKLLLFAFGRGPLSSNLSLTSFILLACFPIKIQNQSSSTKKDSNKSCLNFAMKSIIFATHMPVFKRKPYMHPKLFLVIYSVYLYLGLEIILAAMAALARAFLGVDLEPQFNEPYLSTSLQDFWGRRWNLMVSSILRPTVYDPVRLICSRLIGKERAPLLAVIATFIVSGLMHELIFYYIGRIKPTWELTCFFLLHGAGVAIETVIKKELKGKWRLPPAVSVVLTVSFVMVTGLWLFLPSLMKCEADIRARRETLALFEFLKSLSGMILGFRKEEIIALLSSSSRS